MEVGEDEVWLAMLKDLKSRGQINSATHIYKKATTRPQMLAHSLR